MDISIKVHICYSTNSNEKLMERMLVVKHLIICFPYSFTFLLQQMKQVFFVCQELHFSTEHIKKLYVHKILQ